MEWVTNRKEEGRGSKGRRREERIGKRKVQQGGLGRVG